eukprot:1398487-Ditylum_brightwellii.AAC.1
MRLWRIAITEQNTSVARDFTKSIATDHLTLAENCLEEFRTELYHMKLFELERTIFKILNSSKRKDIDDGTNPMLKQVKTDYDDFVTGNKCYDIPADGIQVYFQQQDKENIVLLVALAWPWHGPDLKLMHITLVTKKMRCLDVHVDEKLGD